MDQKGGQLLLHAHDTVQRATASAGKSAGLVDAVMYGVGIRSLQATNGAASKAKIVRILCAVLRSSEFCHF